MLLNPVLLLICADLSNLLDQIMRHCIFIQVTSPAWSKRTCWTRLWPAWSLSTPSTSKACGSPASNLRTPRWGPSPGATGTYTKFQWCPNFPSSTSVSGDLILDVCKSILMMMMKLLPCMAKNQNLRHVRASEILSLKLTEVFSRRGL